MSLTAVGDREQTIHAYTGASFDHVESIFNTFEDYTYYNLSLNYRSTKTICGHASNLISYNCYENDPHCEPVIVSSSGEQGDPIEIVQHAYQVNEYEWIAEKLGGLDLLNSRPGRIFIIFRTNNEVLDCADVLRTNGIECHVMNNSGYSYWDRKHVKATLSYLEATVNGGDQETLSNIINIPSIEYTVRGSYPATRYIKTTEIVSVFNTVDDFLNAPLPRKFNKAVRDLSSLIDKFRARENINDIIDTVSHYCRHTTGYTDIVDQDLERIKARAEGKTFYELLSSLYQSKGIQERVKHNKTGMKSIYVGTAHSFKGLECDYSIIGGLSGPANDECKKVGWSNWPSKYCYVTPPAPGAISQFSEGLTDIDDERRVFYVAFTRAKLKVILSYYLNNGEKFYSQSQFIGELFKAAKDGEIQ